MALYSLVNEDRLNGAIKATTDAIREKTGSEDPIPWNKETGLADAVPAVYEAGEAAGVEVGKQEAYDAFWDVYQNNGERSVYPYAFAYSWDDSIFKPKYDIVLGSGKSDADNIFVYSAISDIVGLLNQCGVVFDSSNAVQLSSCFRTCSSVSIPPLDMTNCKTTLMTCYDCFSVTKIEVINVQPDCTFDRTFSYCTRLVDFLITGTIGNNISFIGCHALSKDSISNIFAALSSDAVGMVLTLATYAVNNAFATATGAADGATSEEWLALVDTKSNWTISLA